MESLLLNTSRKLLVNGGFRIAILTTFPHQLNTSRQSQYQFDGG